MNYVEIVNLIFSIIFGLYALMMAPFAVFFVVGLFTHKKYPHTEVKNKYGIIIPARNEELVVGNLIESIQKANYPQDKLQIFVIAHNCTDKTAEVARKYGVTVYEYNNPNECTMGYAFRYLFDQIEKDYGRKNYDGFFLFNADNIVSNDYFEKMNDAFEYYEHKYVVTSFRNSKNFGYNTMSGMYGIYFALGCFSESRGRTVCGCSTRVQGTGYVISSKVVENGWPYVTLTEDWEFSADQILEGNKIRYCDEAVFYDEQPTTTKIMWRQRVRWSRGHLLVCYARIKDLWRALFSKETKYRFSTYDIFTNCLPICLALTSLTLIQWILLAFAPLFGISLYDTFIGISDSEPLWRTLLLGGGAFIGFARSAVETYFGTLITGIAVFVLGRKRIVGVSWIKKIWLCLIWPIFIILQFPIDVQALFSRNLGWKPIPHDDSTTIHTLSAKKK